MISSALSPCMRKAMRPLQRGFEISRSASGWWVLSKDDDPAFVLVHWSTVKALRDRGFVVEYASQHFRLTEKGRELKL